MAASCTPIDTATAAAWVCASASAPSVAFLRAAALSDPSVLTSAVPEPWARMVPTGATPSWLYPGTGYAIDAAVPLNVVGAPSSAPVVALPVVRTYPAAAPPDAVVGEAARGPPHAAAVPAAQPTARATNATRMNPAMSLGGRATIGLMFTGHSLIGRISTWKRVELPNAG